MKTLLEIRTELEAWSSRNFPNNDPYDPFEGIVEEIGELAHARLKGRQGIRGTPEEHIAAEKDAIGDATIYILDYSWRNKLEFLEVGTPDPGFAEAAHLEFCEVVQALGDLSRSVAWQRSGHSVSHVIVDLLGYLWYYSIARDFDYLQIVNDTWDHVKSRDWVKYPKNGRSE